MDTSKARANGRRNIHLEALEGRALLSAARPPGIAAEVAFRGVHSPQVPVIRSAIQGHMAPQGMYSGTQAGFTSYAGHGSTSNVGNVFLGMQHVQARSTTPSALNIEAGSAILTTIRGDRIAFSYSGSGTVVNRSETNVVLLGAITGGTGSYSNVTGTFSAAGTLRNGLNSRFNLTITLNITYPTTTT